MDLENQRRVKEAAENFGAENVVVLIGAAEGEAAGLAAETVTNEQLGLAVYHAVEPEFKEVVDSDVFEEQIGMMEMVLDVDDIIEEVSEMRNQYGKY